MIYTKDAQLFLKFEQNSAKENIKNGNVQP